FAALDGQIEVALEYIAHRDRNQVVLLHGVAQIVASHLAHADEGGSDTIIRAADLSGEQRAGERSGGGGFQEGAAIGVGHWVILHDDVDQFIGDHDYFLDLFAV